MEENRKLYETDKKVKEYNAHDFIFPAEKKILNFISEKAGKNNMLDIGVGAGRTTKYFAPFFEKYIGVDYSENMIKACKQKYNGKPYTFEMADARSMLKFDNNTFDFILFSFNGIDFASIEDRDKIIKEIKRICKTDGYFAFSTHSIYNVRKLYSFQMPKNPLKYISAYKHMKKVREINPPLHDVEKRDIIPLHDGDSEFAAEYIYVKPGYQIMSLKKIGFSDIIMFNNNGLTITLDSFSNWKNQDPWIHYLCRNGK